jgi:hypothetical protein
MYGDNLRVFKERLAEGDTPEEAAFKTWTGQQATRYGYTEVKVQLVGRPHRPHEVLVWFKKPPVQPN